MTSTEFLNLELNEVREYIESCSWRKDKFNSWHFGITRVSTKNNGRRIKKFPSIVISYDSEWKRWTTYIAWDTFNYIGFYFLVTGEKITVTGVIKNIKGEFTSISYECV